MSLGGRAGDLLDDLYRYNLINGSWTLYDRAQTGFGPSARSFVGLTSIGDSLYVFGGMGMTGRHTTIC